MSTESLSVCLGPSRLHAALLGAAHALALASLSMALDGLPLFLAAAGVTLSGAYTIGQALQLYGRIPAEFRLGEDGSVAWRDRRGGWRDARLGPGVFVSTWLILLPLIDGAGRRTWIIVAADAAGKDDHRRLRVWLRWRPVKSRERE